MGPTSKCIRFFTSSLLFGMVAAAGEESLGPTPDQRGRANVSTPLAQQG